MATSDPDFSQLSALVSSFQQRQQPQPQQDPLVVDPTDTSTNGMSFQELFRCARLSIHLPLPPSPRST